MKKTLLIFILLLQTVVFGQELNSKLSKTEKLLTRSMALRRAVDDVGFTNRLGAPISVKGDMIYAGNNILSDHKTNGYAGNTANSQISMKYIDVDSDPSTFSSSSSVLNLPTCSRVVYAGLYWSGIYPFQEWPSKKGEVGTPRSEDYNSVKFKVPGSSSYTSITADETIYSAGDKLQRPYVCYKDVTSEVNTAKSGKYWVADVKATIGKDPNGLGSSAGWVLIVIYENKLKSNKMFFVYDGFTSVSKAAGVEEVITINGFKTIPSGDVNVSIINAALEGDQGITGDTYQIKDNSNTFRAIQKTRVNNFFDSSVFGESGPNEPNSANNLGFDVAKINIPHANGFFKNNQTETTVKFTTDGDTFFPYLNAMAVEVIEPDIEFVMTVDNGSPAGSNNLKDANVTLGDQLWYNIVFRNIGTDGGTNTFIKDKLPKNVHLMEAPSSASPSDPNITEYNGKKYFIKLPTGVTISDISKDGNQDVITFSVDDDLVKKLGQSGARTIRFKTQVVETCEELVGVCSNKISNQATVSSKGKTGGLTIEHGSVSGIPVCDEDVAIISNVLVDFDSCGTESKLCENGRVKLVGGTTYDSYEWFVKTGGIFVPVNAADVSGPKGNTYTTRVPGIYKVKKIATAANGCVPMSQIFTVKDFDDNGNPLLKDTFATNTVECPGTEESVDEVYLCGSTASKTIVLPYDVSTTTIKWEKLKDGISDTSDGKCPVDHANPASWEDYTGPGGLSATSYTQKFNKTGNYRLYVKQEGGGCFKYYYFNVYVGGSTPKVNILHSYCGANGKITVYDIPDGSKFLKVPGHVENVPAGTPDSAWGSSKEFTVAPQTTGGVSKYTIFVKSDKNTCISFVQAEVTTLKEMVATVDHTSNPIKCSTTEGKLIVSVTTTIPGGYNYIIRKGSASGSIVADSNTTTDQVFTHNVGDDGDYYVEVVAMGANAQDCKFKGGPYKFTKPKTLKAIATATRNIGCGDGLVNLTITGGTPTINENKEYSYAIVKYTPASTASGATPIDHTGASEADILGLSYTAYKYKLNNITNLYEDISSIPVLDGKEGKYTYVIRDKNGCYIFSNEIEIKKDLPLTFEAVPTPMSCASTPPSNDGVVTVNTTSGSGQGYTISYAIVPTTIPPTTPTAYNSGVSANIFPNLAAGDYTVYIKPTINDVACDPITKNVTITVAPVIVSSATITTDVGCETTGVITFGATSGGNNIAAEYLYGIKKSTETSYTFTNNPVKPDIVAGVTYNLAVKDKGECITKLADITPESLEGMPPFKTPEVDYDCNGKGTFTLEPTATTPPSSFTTFTYVLKDHTNAIITAYGTGPTFTAVPTGVYSVEISAAGACPVPTKVAVNISPYKKLTGEILNSVDATCFESGDGKITIKANNYSDAKFEYSTDGTNWDTAYVAEGKPFNILGLEAGTYTVYIRKSVDCPVTLQGNPVIKQPTKIEITHVVNRGTNCIPGSDKATVTITATGGTPPYQYSLVDEDGNWSTWTTASTDPIEIDVPQGKFEIKVKDGKGCTLCGCDATSFINGSFEEFGAGARIPGIGGSWWHNPSDKIPGWSTTEVNGGKIENWKVYDSGGVRVEPYEGTYFVEINSDSENALYQDFCTQPGDIITWSVAHRARTKKGKDKAEVLIGKTIGTAVRQKVFDEANNEFNEMETGHSDWKVYHGKYEVPAGQKNTIIAFDATYCASGNNTIGNFIDNVKFSVERPSCPPADFTVPVPEEVVIDLNAKISCYKSGSTGSSVKLTVSGGKKNYRFRKDGGPWKTPTPANSDTYTFENLVPKIESGVVKPYKFEATDANECVSGEREFTVNKEISAVTSKVNMTCGNKGSITVTPSGGDGTYTYKIEKKNGGGTYATFMDFPTPNASLVQEITAEGDYKVIITDNSASIRPDGKSCTHEEFFSITKEDGPTVTTTGTEQPKCSTGGGKVAINISGGKEKFTVEITQTLGGTFTETLTNQIAGTVYKELPSGKYSIKVTDANNCTVSTDVTLTSPNELKGNVGLDPIYSCNQPATVKFTGVSGGKAPYQYSIDGGVNFQTSPDFPNQLNGEIKPVIIDDNDCKLPLTNFTIPELPVIPEFDYDIEYDCEGKAKVTLKLKTPDSSVDLSDFNYTGFTQTTPSSNYTFDGISHGNYTVTVSTKGALTDPKACDVTVDVVVEQNKLFTGSIVADSETDHIVCKIVPNGTVTIKASFYGTGGYSYEVLKGGIPLSPRKFEEGITTPTHLIEGLVRGDYIVNIYPTGIPGVTGVTGTKCVLSDSFTIGGPDDNLVVTAPTVANGLITKSLTCSEPTGATVVGQATGGTKDYVFKVQINQSGPWTTELNNIPQGTHNIKVIDANKCEDVKPFVIDDIVKPTHSASVLDYCYKGEKLKVEVTAAGGNPGSPIVYTFGIKEDGATTFTWMSSNQTDLTKNIFSVGPGTHEIKIKDANGCESDMNSVTINDQLIGKSVSKKDITCNPGEIVVQAVGGGYPRTSDSKYKFELTGPHSETKYEVAGTNVTFEIPVSKDGTYNVKVSDDKGCSFDIENIVIAKIEDLEVTATATQPKCSTGTGNVVVNIVGGTPPFNIEVDGDSSSPTNYSGITDRSYTITDPLAADSYAIKVTDANGCIKSINPKITITNPNAVTATVTVTDYICNQDATIVFSSVTGGTPGASPNEYSYSIDGGTTWSSNPSFTVRNGTYNFVVKDANECKYPIDTEKIIKPLPIIPDFQTVTPTYDCEGKGIVALTPLSGSAGDYSYSMVVAPPATLVGSPVINSNGEFNTLEPGFYTVTVTESTGRACSKDVTFAVDPNKEFTAGFEGTKTDIKCKSDSSGTITIEASNFANFDGAEFFYTISTEPGTPEHSSSTSPKIITGLKAGIHIIKAYVKVGGVKKCEITLPDIELTEPTDGLAWGTHTFSKQVTCIPATGATIVPVATGGAGNYTYEISLDNGTTWTTTLSDIPAGTHKIKVTDGNDCTLPGTFIVEPKKDVVFTKEPSKCYEPDASGAPAGTVLVKISQFNNDLDGNATNKVSLTGGAYTGQFVSAVENTVTSTYDYTFTNLEPGIEYTIKVKDARGCEKEDKFTINKQLLATAEVLRHISCDVPPVAKIKLVVTGGKTKTTVIPPATPTDIPFNDRYEYSVVKRADPATPSTGPGAYKPLINYDTSSSSYIIDGTLAPASHIAVEGTYDIYIKDGNDCKVTVQKIEVKKVPKIDFELTGVEGTCGGDKGGIKIKIPQTSSGTPDYFITVTNPDGDIIQVVTGTPVMNGTTEVTAITSQDNFELNNLVIGEEVTHLLDPSDLSSPSVTRYEGSTEYTVVVTDAYGCSSEHKITLQQAPYLDDFALAPILPTDCEKDFVGNENEFGFEFTGYYVMDGARPSTIKPLPALPTPIYDAMVTGSIGYKYEFRVKTYDSVTNTNIYTAWQESAIFTGYDIGTIVYPEVRLVYVDIDGTTTTNTERCIRVLNRYIIPYKPVALVSTVQMNSTGDCAQGADAVITIDPVQSGTRPYQYGWSTNGLEPVAGDPGQYLPPTNSLTHTFPNLPPGDSYHFFVKDSRGCVSVDDDYLDEYPIKVNGKILNQGCETDGGQFEFNIVDQSTPGDYFDGLSATKPIYWKLYEIGDPLTPVRSGQSATLNILVGNGIPATNSSVAPGIYNLTIEYGVNGSGTSCSPIFSKQFEIREGSPIKGTPRISKNASCGKAGHITIDDLSGGSGNYSFAAIPLVSGTPVAPPLEAFNTLNPNPINEVYTGGTPKFDPLIAGKYDIFVKDGTDCIYHIGNIEMLGDPEPLLELNTDNNNCKKAIKNIEAVAYTAINDPLDATKKLPPMVPIKFSITSPTFYPKDPATATDPIDQRGMWTGSITTIDATNRVSHIFSDLKPKDEFTPEVYSITTMDKNGCESGAKEETIYPDLKYEIGLTKDVDCKPADGNGQITVKIISGATGKYIIKGTNTDTSASETIFLNGSLSPTTDWQVPVEITNASETIVFDVTKGGNYKIEIDTDQTVTNALPSCPIEQEVVVAPKLPVDFEFVKTDAKCKGSRDGKIVVTSVSGATPKTYTIVQTTVIAGLTYSNTSTDDPEFNNLPAGTYEVTVTGTNFCFETKTITIKDPLKIGIVASNIETKQFECTLPPVPGLPVTPIGNVRNSASIKLKVADILPLPTTPGGAVRSISRIIFYKGSIDVANEKQNGLGEELIINDVSGGNYYIKVFDNVGCSQEYGPIEIKPFNEIKEIKINQDKPNYCDSGEKITVTAVVDFASSMDMTFTIKGETAGASHSGGSTSTVTSGAIEYAEQYTNLSEGLYTITVKNNVTGCTLSEQYTVEPTPADKYTVDINVTDNSVCTATAQDSEVKFNISSPYTGKYTYIIYKGTPPGGTAQSGGDSGFQIVTTEVSGEQTVKGALDSGDYYIVATMTENPNCPVTSTAFTIEKPVKELDAKAEPTAPKCIGDKGSILATSDFVTVGGYGNYTFSLLEKVGTTFTEIITDQASPLFSNLDVGIYKIKVTDGNGCTDLTGELEIKNPDALGLDVQVTDNSCDDSKLGSIKMIGSGGTVTVLPGTDVSYTYTLTKDGVNDSNTDGNFPNLVPGEYTASVTDGNNCSFTPITVKVNKPLEFTLTKVKEIDCTVTPGDPKSKQGKAILKVISGSGGPYKYKVELSVSGSSTSEVTLTGITENTEIPVYIHDNQEYKVTVYDLGNRINGVTNTIGCDKSELLKFDDKIEPKFKPTPTDVTCFGASDGTIQLLPEEFTTLPYEYTISSSVTLPASYVTTIKSDVSSIFTGLPKGEYTITAKSVGNSCETSISGIIIGSPDKIEFPMPVVTPFGCTTGNDPNNAVITVSGITPATPPGGGIYKVKFVDQDGNTVQNSSSLTYVTSKYEGHTYKVTVYNTQCESDVKDVVVPAYKKLLEAAVTVDKPIDCNGTEDIKVNFTSSAVPNNIATANFTISKSDASPYPYTPGPGQNVGTAEGIFTGLLTGSYTITVTNPDTGCKITVNHTVKEQPKYELDVTVTNANVCFDPVGGTLEDTGSISFAFTDASPKLPPFTGGYAYEVLVSGTTSPAIKSGTGTGTDPKVVTGLAPGDYYVKLKMDALSSPYCEAVSNKFTIYKPDNKLDFAPEVLVNPTCKEYKDGSITATGKDGYGSYTYSLSGGTLVSPVDNGNSGYFTGLGEGTYTVTVTDSNKCSKSVDYTLTNPSELGIDVEKLDNVCSTDRGVIKVKGNGGRTDLSTYNYTVTHTDGSLYTGTGSATAWVEFTNLKAGAYTISVTNGGNCDAATKTVTLLPDLEFDLVEEKLIDCKAGNEDGIAKISVLSSGSGNYEYKVIVNPTVSTDPGFPVGTDTELIAQQAFPSSGTTATFNAKYPGTYTVKVYDMDALPLPVCYKEQTITFLEPIKPKFEVREQEIMCNNDKNGRLIIRSTSTDGLLDADGIYVKPEYTISPNTSGEVWNDVDMSFDNLLPNIDYYVTVKSKVNDCSSKEGPFKFDDPSIINIKPDAVSNTEFGCDVTTNGFTSAKITVNLDGVSKIEGGTTIDTDPLDKHYAKVNIYKGLDTNLLPIQTYAINSKGDTFEFTVSDTEGGKYTVEVIDANNCSGTYPVEIKPYVRLKEIDINTLQVNTCGLKEKIEVSVTNYSDVLMTEDVTFSLLKQDRTSVGTAYENKPVDNVSGKAEFDNLDTGIYIVVATYTKTGCKIETEHQVLEAPKYKLVVNKVKGSVCSPTGIEGKVTLDYHTDTPYTGTYDYTVYYAEAIGTHAIDDVVTTVTGPASGTGGTPIEIAGLPEGLFYIKTTMTASAAMNCESKSNNFRIVKPDVQLSVDFTQIFIPCTKGDGGGLILTGKGGTGNYTYKVTKGSVMIQDFDNNNFILDQLDAGTYQITVMDDSGCVSDPVDAKFDDPIAITADISSPTITCSGYKDATLVVTNPGGGQMQALVPPATSLEYMYSLKYPPGLNGVEGKTTPAQVNNTFTGLGAGTYTVYVHSNFACKKGFDFTIDPVDEVVVSADVNGKVQCDDDKVKVVLTATGGSGTYTYTSVDGITPSPSDTFTVTPGEHYFYATDDKTCISKEVSVVVGSLEPLEISVEELNLMTVCNNESNATIISSATGGEGNYIYTLERVSGSGTVPSANNTGIFTVGKGTYKVKVTTNGRCDVFSELITVGEPDEITAKPIGTDPTCFGYSNGEINMTDVAGGTYKYGNLEGYTFRISTDPPNFFRSNPVFKDLPAGTHIITVSDARGCSENFTVKLGEPSPIVLSNDPSNNTDQQCSDDPAPTFEVKVEGGTPNYTLTLFGDKGEVAKVTVSTDGGVYKFEGKDGVEAGKTYIVQVTDAGSCIESSSLSITTAESKGLDFTYTQTYNCETGMVDIVGAVKDNLKNVVTYSLYNGGTTDLALPANDTGIFAVPADGKTYTLEVRHVDGSYPCKPPGETFTVDNRTKLVISQDTSDSQYPNRIVIIAEGGVPAYQYSFDGGATFGDSNQLNFISSGIINVVVKDEAGCQEILDIPVEYVPIKIPNYFTPDGDGINDTWYPYDIGDNQNIRVYIYDRYGRKIATYEGVQSGWDGLYNGKPLPRGDYWYTIFYNNEIGEDKKLIGHFTLYRKE